MDRDDGAQFELRIRPQGFAFERGVNEFEEILLEPTDDAVELERQIATTAEAFAKGEPLISAREARKSVIICLAAEETARTNKNVFLKF